MRELQGHVHACETLVLCSVVNPVQCIHMLSTVQSKARVLALVNSSRDQAVAAVNSYLSKRTVHDVLVISYETFRIHAELFGKSNAEPVDLLICDEAHRLKNNETKTTKALAGLSCRRRVLLSGTPMQNHLDEVRPILLSFCLVRYSLAGGGVFAGIVLMFFQYHIWPHP